VGASAALAAARRSRRPERRRTPAGLAAFEARRATRRPSRASRRRGRAGVPDCAAASLRASCRSTSTVVLTGTRSSAGSRCRRPIRRHATSAARPPSRRCSTRWRVHYKGSGFYSTDYGRGSKKKEQSDSSGESSSSTSGGGEGSTSSGGESKAGRDEEGSRGLEARKWWPGPALRPVAGRAAPVHIEALAEGAAALDAAAHVEVSVGGGGWLRGLPREHREHEAVVVVGPDHEPVESDVASPPRRQCRTEPFPVRNLFHAEPTICHVERSVASGFTRSPPLSGSLKNVSRLVSLPRDRLHDLLLGACRG